MVAFDLASLVNPADPQEFAAAIQAAPASTRARGSRAQAQMGSLPGDQACERQRHVPKQCRGATHDRAARAIGMAARTPSLCRWVTCRAMHTGEYPQLPHATNGAPLPVSPTGAPTCSCACWCKQACQCTYGRTSGSSSCAPSPTPSRVTIATWCPIASGSLRPLATRTGPCGKAQPTNTQALTDGHRTRQLTQTQCDARPALRHSTSARHPVRWALGRAQTAACFDRVPLLRHRVATTPGQCALDVLPKEQLQKSSHY